MITNLRMDLFQALVRIHNNRPGWWRCVVLFPVACRLLQITLQTAADPPCSTTAAHNQSFIFRLCQFMPALSYLMWTVAKLGCRSTASNFLNISSLCGTLSCNVLQSTCFAAQCPVATHTGVSSWLFYFQDCPFFLNIFASFADLA